MSLLLVDCVRAVVEEGKPVTARQVARRVGGDVFRVEEILRSLVKRGSLREEVLTSQSKGVARTCALYCKARPRRRAGGDELAEQHRPLPGQQSFPVFGRGV